MFYCNTSNLLYKKINFNWIVLCTYLDPSFSLHVDRHLPNKFNLMDDGSYIIRILPITSRRGGHIYPLPGWTRPTLPWRGLKVQKLRIQRVARRKPKPTFMLACIQLRVLNDLIRVEILSLIGVAALNPATWHSKIRDLNKDCHIKSWDYMSPRTRVRNPMHRSKSHFNTKMNSSIPKKISLTFYLSHVTY